MYVPRSFAVTDKEQLFAFMTSHPFATLVTQGNAPTASHLPLLLHPNDGPFGTLVGHFAGPNPQSLSAGASALAIFIGPHAYISPKWYEEGETVPTWNYVAVHATGRLEIEDDPKVVLALLDEMARAFEPDPDGWRFDPESPWIQKLLPGIVAFRLVIETLEGKWKLSQNHSPARRQRVQRQLAKSQNPRDRETADFMRETFSPIP